MKGISPLIAAVLLIAFTVAIGGIVSIFFTSFTKQTTSGVSSQGQALISCTGSAPTVDLVRYNSTLGNMVNITYTNPGAITLQNIVIYTTLSNSTTNTTVPSSPTLPPAASNSIALNLSGGGAPTEVRVVGVCSTSTGNQTVSGSCLTGQGCMIGVA
jgi:flagellin-like protein